MKRVFDRLVCFGAEGVNDRARACNADRWQQNGQFHARFAKFHELRATALYRTEQAGGVQETIAQRSSTHALLHLVRLGGKAARPEQVLKERE